MNRKNILIITDDISQRGGGAAVITNIHAIGLSKIGYKVTVVTTVDKRELVGESIENGIRIIRLYSNYNPRYRSYLSLYNPFIIYKIKAILKNETFDIVHFHNIHYHISYYSISLAKKYSKSVFVTIHDSMPFHYSKLFPDDVNSSDCNVINYKISPIKQLKDFKSRYNPFRNIIIKSYLKKANKIFSVSNALKNALNDNGIDNIEVINNGIDINKWEIDIKEADNFINKFNLNGKRVIFFGGRLSSAKGGEIILDIIVNLIKDYPDIILLIVGNKDEYANKMLSKAVKMRIDKNIVFTGWLDNKYIKYAYNACFITLVPSLCFDWFPTNILESMICRRPVIGNCFGGAKEIIEDNKNGIILNPNNKSDLENKIRFLIENDSTLRDFGNHSYDRIINNFTIDKYIQKLDSWYHL